MGISQSTNLNISTSTKSPADIERSCPIIFELESGILICEGRGRHVNGKVKIDGLNDCHVMQVKGNKVVCNTKTEHDIFCPVLPRNTTSITLVEAQSICQQKFQEAIKTDKADSNEPVTENTEPENTDSVVRLAVPFESVPAVVVVEATNDQTVQPISSTERGSNQLP